jgi:DNA polymerase III epsilon subunit family exonuclease
MTSPGITTRPEATMLSEKAAIYLREGPADVVALIGHICNLPGAPRVVAEHMARAIFAGRPEFERDDAGRWSLTTVGKGRLRASAARSQDLASLSWVVVDVETTGGPPPAHRITEFAAAVVKNGEVTSLYETLVNPQRPIPPFVTRLTRITHQMVERAPTFSAIVPRVLESLEGNVFVAHNAAYDWHFVTHEVARTSGARIVGPQLCTVQLARRLHPHLPRRSLDHIASYYGVEIGARHRAGGDALATARCLIRMLDDVRDRGCETWDDLQRLVRDRKKRKGKRRRSALPSPVDKDTTA